MKRVLFVGVVLAAFGLFPLQAAALSITKAYCAADPSFTDHASCPAGLGATLEITDVGLEDGEANDYYVILTLDSTATAGLTGINGVQFDSQYKTTDYDQDPTLASVPDGGPFTVEFGQINDCPSDNVNDKSVCSIGTTDTGDVDVWKFYIDLVDTITTPFSDEGALNLRASFLPTGNLSPGGQTVTEEGGEGGEEGGGEGGEEGGGEGGEEGGGEGGEAVPEPASLLLLGSGLAMGAARLRRQNKQ